MDNPISAIIAGTFLLYLVICAILVPVVGYSSWLAKRDCQLLAGSECAWQMLAKEPTE